MANNFTANIQSSGVFRGLRGRCCAVFFVGRHMRGDFRSSRVDWGIDGLA